MLEFKSPTGLLAELGAGGGGAHPPPLPPIWLLVGPFLAVMFLLLSLFELLLFTAGGLIALLPVGGPVRDKYNILGKIIKVIATRSTDNQNLLGVLHSWGNL